MKAGRTAVWRQSVERWGIEWLVDPNAFALGLLDEIDRLEGLVRAAHRFDYGRTTVVWVGGDTPHNFAIRVFCTGCAAAIADLPCKDPYGSPRTDEAKAAHAAHVQALIDGGAE